MVGTGVATIGVVGPGGSGVPLLGAGANADPVFAPINLAGGTSVLSGLLPVSNQAIISVTNAAALAALPTSAMSPGQAATVQSIQQTFRLNPSSTVVPDNVSYISAQNGGNWVSSLTVPSGRSITALQGGLVSAPAVEAPLLIQPANLSRAPFGHSLSTHFFNGVDDNTCNWGYNPAFDGTGTEPNAVLNIEADFSSLPGVHQLEMYFATTMPGVGQAVRPMGFVLNRVTGEVTCSIQYAGGGLILVGGTIAGPPHTEINFADGSMSFPNGNYTIQSTGGALSLIANANMTLGCNSFMEITIAAGNVWALDTDIGSFRVAAGTEVCAFDTTVSAFRLYPHTDSTGSIGLNAKRWGLVRGLVVSSGDLDLCDEERGAHWTLREEPDCILAVNRVTDEWYKLPLAPLSQEERSRYESVPLKSEHLDAEAMVAVLKARRAA
jgi:hypothetical protein